MSSSLDAKTSRTVEAMIQVTMPAAMRGSKNRITGEAEQEAGGDRRQGYVDVADIVNAVHDEAQTVGLESGNRFDHENRGVERGGCGKRSAIMGHGEVVIPIF